MANDRLMLVCDTCGADVVIYKFYPDGGWTPEKAAERLGEFIGTHLEDCHGKHGQGHLGADSGFSVVTEEGLLARKLTPVLSRSTL